MFVYTTTSCRYKKNCRDGLHCNYSHNFYESHFHPSKYKRNRCNKPNECRFGKFCPFYHTNEEKELWKIQINQIFDFSLTDNQNDDFMETYDKFDEPDRFEDYGPHKIHAAGEGPHHHHHPHVPHHNPPHHPPPGHVPHFGGNHEEKKSSLSEHSMSQETKVKLTKNIHATLLVRKQFESVKLFSELLKKQTVHTTYPLMVNIWQENV